MEIVLRKVEDLKGYDKNARTHSDEQLGNLCDSISVYGFLDPIEVTKDLIVISGHARLAAAIKLGLTQVPTICHSHLDKKLTKGYTLAANRIQLSAGWDASILENELQELKEDGFDLKYTGFTQDEIDAYLNPEVLKDGLVDEDECGDVSTEDPTTRLGDIWILGNHRLMCGDSTMIDDVEKLMNGEKADMVFTDPPYNIASENKGFASNSGNKQMKVLMDSKWDKNFNPKEFMNCLLAYLSNDCTVYICTFHHLASAIWEWMKEWSDHNSWCVWSKPNPMPSLSKRHWTWNAELICYATRGKHIFNFPNNGHALCVWDFTKVAKCDLHPTMKPVSIPEHAILHSSSVNHSVLDLFGGSGSTLIACEKTNRKCYMMEIAPNYCDVIIKRWQKFTGERAILEATGEFFDDVEA